MIKKSLTAISIIVILVLIAIALVAVGSLLGIKTKEVKITTDKKDYKIEDTLKMNIENNMDEKICFSSCYPYHIENKNGREWKVISYSACPTDNLVEKCVNSKENKAFESVLPSLKEGGYRLAVPVCTGCNSGESFEENQWFYSNEFVISE